jgi:hypothetical protein
VKPRARRVERISAGDFIKTVFISHASADKPFVFRLAFELLSEGVPVWLDTWELGPGDPLIASLDSALNGGALVLVVMSSNAAATKWVKYEVQKTLETEERLGQRLLVPVRIDGSACLDELQGRVHINLIEGPTFMDGVHALLDHLRLLGISADQPGRCVLPLAFHKAIELDTFILERILSRWIGHGLEWSEIAPETMHLLKSERLNTLQRKLRARISTYWSDSRATAEGLNVLRTLDVDVEGKERDLRERSALILREFGDGFGLGNGHVIEVVRWYARMAMHYLMGTLEAAEISGPETTGEFYEALKSLPAYQLEPSTAQWWKIDDPVKVRVHHRDRVGRYHTTGSVMLPRTALRASKAAIAEYPGVAFAGAFEFDALPRFVLPQMVHGTALGQSSSPVAWDEDNFRIWERSD